MIRREETIIVEYNNGEIKAYWTSYDQTRRNNNRETIMYWTSYKSAAEKRYRSNNNLLTNYYDGALRYIMSHVFNLERMIAGIRVLNVFILEWSRCCIHTHF